MRKQLLLTYTLILITSINYLVKAQSLSNASDNLSRNWSTVLTKDTSLTSNIPIKVQTQPTYNNVITQDATCDNNDGSITIFYDIDPNQTGVQFSIDGGSTYPYNAPYTNVNTVNPGVADPFECRSGFYQVINSISAGQLYIFDVTTSTYTAVGSGAGFRYNSTGLNTDDNFIYGMSSDNGGTDAVGVTVNKGDLVKIDKDGEAFKVGTVSGISGNSTFAGEVYDGHMWVTRGNQLYKVNLSNANVEAQMTLSGNLGADFVITNDKIYSVTSNQFLAVGDLTNVQNGQTINVNYYSLSGSQSGSHGAAWVATNSTTGFRELYFSYNTDGRIYRIDNYTTNSPIATWVAQGQVTSANDGAGCPTAQAGVFTGEDSYTIPNLPGGTYSIFARWSDGSSPTFLTSVTIQAPNNCQEVCNDGVDNDNDGLIDCDDPDCYLAANSGDNDTDNDGIGDLCDLDDDNDGILDDEEGCVSPPPAISGVVLGGDLLLNDVTFSASNGAVLDISTGTNYVLSQSPAGQPEPSGQTYITGYDAANNQGSAVVTLNNPITYQVVNELVVRIQYYNNCLEVGATYGNDDPAIILHTSQGDLTLNHVLTPTENNVLRAQNWIPLEFRVPVTGNAITLTGMTLRLETIGGGIGTFRPTRSEVFGIGFDFVGSDIICTDTDNDGIVDSQDPDSDGDGCLDVVESGGTDNNNDGKLDGSGTDNQGKVTGGTGGYNGALGSETIAAQASIITPPSNQTKNTGESVTFTVVVQGDAATSYTNGAPVYDVPDNDNSNLTYQWYIGNPNSSGTPLSDGGIYSGVTTSTLNISNVSGLDGTQYCVLVSNANNKCIRLIRCANLSVNTTEICDDGQDNDGDGLIDCADTDCIPATPAVGVTSPSCTDKTGGQIVVTGAGAFSYTYSITNEVDWKNSGTFNNLGVGQYIVRIRNSSGCESEYVNNPVIFDIPTCTEICNDNIDNDGDGLIDCDDPDCGTNQTNNIQASGN